MNLCKNKEICGSCKWSHIPYDKQLQQKLSDINGSFAIKKLDVQCEEILPSPKTEHYRNRMDFVINFEGKVGMREAGKWWRVIDDHTCFLADPQIDSLFETTRNWVHASGLSYFDRKAHVGFLRYAVIRATTKGETMITIVTSAPTDEQEKLNTLEALKKLATDTSATTLLWAINHTITDVSQGDDLHVISGPGYIEEEINGFTYRITPNAFFQTNSHGAGVLLDTVHEFAGNLENKVLLDLYCGSGFFSVSFAKKAKQVIGVELVEEAIRDARTNAELNEMNIEFFAEKTEEHDWGKYGADVVILDPPRSGMHDKALEDVIRIQPKEIIYVSCNYKNFARELVELQKYYNVTHMRAIDMFPHTPHVELVTRLEKH